MDSIATPKHPDAKKIFRKLGTCSRTFTYLLNREFDNINEIDERAADPLSGGIMRNGYQCGMLWGSSLAVGKAAYRKFDDLDTAMEVALIATQKVMQSFEEREHTIHCREVTNCNFKSRWSFMKYLLSGKFLYCFKMAEEWAPNAINAAYEGLKHTPDQIHQGTLNCASTVVKSLGGNEEEMVLVAGFAGGLGLSGSACGALSAAIWYKSKKWAEEHPGKSPYSTPEAAATLEAFEDATLGAFNCEHICRRTFQNSRGHHEYIKNGGCKHVVASLISK